MSQFHVLIVDDEIHAIRGVEEWVNWEKHDISTVYTAQSLKQAQEIILNNKVDLLLCDIEMPKGSGIDLLKWVKEHYPKIEVIFLTMHSDFSFAKQALQLKSFDYLLKPVDYQELEVVIQKALQKIKQDREAKMVEESYQSVLRDRFWLDLIQEIIPSTVEKIEEHMLHHQVTFPDGTTFLPILFHVQRWKKEFSVHEEKVREYALQKAVGEVIAKNNLEGHVVNLGTGDVIVIIPLDRPTNLEELVTSMNPFISEFSQYFSCDLCCYLGKQVTIQEIVSMVHNLQKIDRNNVNKSNQTIEYKNGKEGSCTFPQIPSANWTSLMKSGQKAKLLEAINQYFAEWKRSEHINAQVLHLFYQDYLQLVFYVLQVKAIQANQVYSQNLLTEKPVKVLTSLDSLQEWVIYIADVAMNQLHLPLEKESVVEIVKKYINENLAEHRLNREIIANYVYLNPDYLTRLFKKQTGLSISDYLQLQRIEYAEKLLKETNLTVSEVGMSVGYSSFSHFSAVFKKISQLNPVDYRKTLEAHR
jgi:two-component system, response regulator YesN